MADPPVPQVSLSDLGPMTRIGSGGQGTVFALQEDPRVVYKEYAPRFVDDIDVAALNRFVQLTAAGGPDADSLLGLAAWPTAIVRKGGVVRGFLMPRVPEQYTVRLELPSGPASVLAQLQFLLNSDDYLRARGLAVDDRLRFEILRDTGEALATFHRLGICVGDFSPQNLLFSATDRPRCYFIDCDAMRLDGDSVLAQAETPEWHMPVADGDQAGEELATPATDAYKFGLLVVRLFAGDQQVRDPAAAGHRLRGDLRRLTERSLSAGPEKRPEPGRWIAPLDAAIARTPPSPPEPPPSPPAAATSPTPPVRTSVPRPVGVGRRAGSVAGRWPMWLPLVAVLIGLLWGVLDSSDDSTIPAVRYTGAAVQPRYTYDPLPAPYKYTPPDLSGLGTFPTLVDPFPTLDVACPVINFEVGKGLNPADPRVKAAMAPLSAFACELENDNEETAFSGRDSAPDATQRGRFAKLADHAPYYKLTIIGVRAGTGGTTQVNVVFAPLPAGRSTPCWRSRVSLAGAGDDRGVVALTAPAEFSCG